jgi:hypothetical protein
MSEERGLTTDQLSNIIQVIQLGRKSSQLIVERGEGMTLENGEITHSFSTRMVSILQTQIPTSSLRA